MASIRAIIGRMTWARSLMNKRPSSAIPVASRPSISWMSFARSSTVPLPMTIFASFRNTPEGTCWRACRFPPIVTVCPALGPPWYRATTWNRSERRSTTLPLPSSPHCAPTTARFSPIVSGARHGCEEGLNAERERLRDLGLVEEPLGPELLEELEDVLLVDARDREHRRVLDALVLAHLAQDVEPGHPRHQEIEDDDVGVLVPDHAQGLDPVAGEENLVPGGGQQPLAGLEHQLRVVGHEHLLATGNRPVRSGRRGRADLVELDVDADDGLAPGAELADDLLGRGLADQAKFRLALRAAHEHASAITAWRLNTIGVPASIRACRSAIRRRSRSTETR